MRNNVLLTVEAQKSQTDRSAGQSFVYSSRWGQ